MKYKASRKQRELIMGRPWLLIRMIKFRNYHRPKNPLSAIPKTQKLWKSTVLTHATHDAGARCQLYLSVSVWRLTDECDVATATIYNLKKQKDKFLKFHRDGGDQNTVKNRKMKA